MPQVGVVPCTGRPLLKCPRSGWYLVLGNMRLRPVVHALSFKCPRSGWYLVLDDHAQMPQVGVVPCTGRSTLVVSSKCPRWGGTLYWTQRLLVGSLVQMPQVGVVPCTGQAASRSNAPLGWYLVLGAPSPLVVSLKCPAGVVPCTGRNVLALVQMPRWGGTLYWTGHISFKCPRSGWYLVLDDC